MLRRQMPGLCLFLAGALAVAGNVPAPEPRPGEPLASSFPILANSNLLGGVHLSGKESLNVKAVLELGRLQKTQKNMDLAARTFSGLLEEDVPHEIKREALLELALLAQEQNQLGRAIQIFSQFLKRFPEDSNLPEILLRQGLLYRQMGAMEMAVSKFYGVMTSSLKSRYGNLDYYKRLVLQAQTEIAETYYLQGKHKESAEFLERLLKQDTLGPHKKLIQYKLVRSLAALGNYPATIAQAELFLSEYPDEQGLEPEIRYLLAQALKQTGRKEAALQQTYLLLKGQQDPEHAKTRAYWQQRLGNELGNEFYHKGEYVSALEVYQVLAGLDSSATWQVPVWYQSGLIFEKLAQPAKAEELYAKIMARQKELDSKTSPGLQTVMDMAKWRAEFLQWQLGLTTAKPASKVE